MIRDTITGKAAYIRCHCGDCDIASHRWLVGNGPDGRTPELHHIVFEETIIAIRLESYINRVIPSAIVRGRHTNTVLGGLAAVFDDLDDLALEVHHSIFMTPSLSRRCTHCSTFKGW